MTFTTRFFPIVFVCLGLIVATDLAYKRIQFEQKTKQIELAIPLKDVQKLAYTEGISLTTCLQQLKASQTITSIVVDEDTWEELSRTGQVTMLGGGDLINRQSLETAMVSQSQNEPFFNKAINPKATYILPHSTTLSARLYTLLSTTYPPYSRGEAVKKIGPYIQCFLDPDTVKLMGLGVSEASVKLVEEAHFPLIIRLKNNPTLTSELIQNKFSIFSNIKTNLVIFEGTQVLGYPNAFPAVKQAIETYHLQVGIIEFADQLGAKTLAASIPDQSFRVHSIPEAEIALKYTPASAIQRFVRSAKERNMRLLIVHPFLTSADTRTVLTFNLDYFRSLSQHLRTAGLEVAPNTFQKIPYPSASSWQLLALGLGGVSLGIWLLGLSSFWVLYTGPLAILFIACLFTGHTSWFALLSAWFIAAGFPILALLHGHKGPATFKHGAIYISKLCGICLAGGLFISGLLSQKSYWLGITMFSGIKLAFIVPLAAVALWAFSQSEDQSPFELLKKWFRSPVTFGFAILGCLGLGILGLYLLRSGNSGLVPGIERHARNSLEQLFWIRPRTKEFLIGFPLLTLAFFHAKSPWFKPYKPYVLTLGTMALVSILNTFCHLHSPLLIALYRSSLGAGLGYIVGYCVILADRFVRNPQ